MAAANETVVMVKTIGCTAEVDVVLVGGGGGGGFYNYNGVLAGGGGGSGYPSGVNIMVANKVITLKVGEGGAPGDSNSGEGRHD